MPIALRDALIRQLEDRSSPIVGNIADLNRLGATTVASGGPDETFRVNPAVDEDEARKGAQRVVDEEEETHQPIPPPEAGPDEPREEKDHRELLRDGSIEADVSVGTTATSTRTRRASTTGGE
jgi:hypothetical protein